MRTVWKFRLAIAAPQSILMPMGAEILTAQMQSDELYLWAILTTSPDSELRVFEVFGTGQSIHQGTGVSRKYIATVQDGPYVWHIFERTH